MNNIGEIPLPTLDKTESLTLTEKAKYEGADMSYNPSDFGIVNDYRKIETIYNERLASSTVWTVKRIDDGSPVPIDTDVSIIHSLTCIDSPYPEVHYEE